MKLKSKNPADIDKATGKYGVRGTTSRGNAKFTRIASFQFCG